MPNTTHHHYVYLKLHTHIRKLKLHLYYDFLVSKTTHYTDSSHNRHNEKNSVADISICFDFNLKKHYNIVAYPHEFILA